MASLMSDAPLSKEEIAEEEMRQELKDVGLYYENMGVDEMKQIINVLNESKNDSRNPNEDTVDDSTLFSETRSTQDVSKATENTTKKPLPSFSYSQAVLSNTSQNSPLNELKNSNDKNSQASSSNSYEKNYTANSSDSEPIYDKNSNLKKDEDYPTLGNRYKTRSTTAEGPKTRSQESKRLSLPTTAKRSSLERWLLDPLEFVKDNNTTQLCSPQRSKSHLEESLPFHNAAVDLDSEEFDKLCQQMIEKLDTFSKQCAVELTASEKMAAPIKINQAEEPANKVSVKEKPLSTNTQGSSTPTRNTYDRATKRKALSTIAAATTFENDENSNDEFSNTKKRKFQQGKKDEEEAKKNQENQKNKNKNTAKPIETISIDDSKDSQDTEFDNSDLHNIRKNSNKKQFDTGSEEAQSQYPRRIQPPIPGKKNYKGPRAKKNNSTLIQNKCDSEKKKMFLNDDEINKTLQELDEQIDDNDCVEITDDIKPSPMPKCVNKRLSLAANHLENAQKLKEQKLKAEEEAKEQREKEERLKMDELISSRLQEKENEDSRRLEKQRKFDEQTALYNNILDSKSRVTRSTFQQKKTEEEIAEDLLLDGDDDEPTITKVIEKHMCPICQKPFPADKIETHASGCDAYATDSSETYNRPSTSRYTDNYKCHICDEYTTNNGNLYDDHVVHCRTKNLTNGEWISK